MTTLVQRARQLAVPGQMSPRRVSARWASQLGITSAFLIAWAVFTILAPDTFLKSRIYVSYAQTVPYFALTALALTMLIVAGDIDLSFPSVFVLGMTGYVGVERTTHNVRLGVVAALLIGGAAGQVHGFFVAVVVV